MIDVWQTVSLTRAALRRAEQANSLFYIFTMAFPDYFSILGQNTNLANKKQLGKNKITNKDHIGY